MGVRRPFLVESGEPLLQSLLLFSRPPNCVLDSTLLLVDCFHGYYDIGTYKKYYLVIIFISGPGFLKSSEFS